MAASEYYNSTGTPATGSQGSSSAVRAEFDLVEAGFGKLPDLSGNADKVAVINSGETAITAKTRAAVVSEGTNGATSKATPVDADELPLVDSAASNGLKKLTWANLKAAIASYYNGLAATMTNKTLTSPTITGATIGVASGVAFPATQSASGDANTLDDYEEAAPSITIKRSTSDPTYSLNGEYSEFVATTKIGNVVFVTVYIPSSAFVSVTGQGTGSDWLFRLTSLPIITGGALTLHSGNVPVRFSGADAYGRVAFVNGNTVDVHVSTTDIPTFSASEIRMQFFYHDKGVAFTGGA